MALILKRFCYARFSSGLVVAIQNRRLVTGAFVTVGFVRALVIDNSA